MKKLFLGMLLSLVLVITGCAPTAPQADIEAEKAAIQAADAECLQAAQTRDVQGALAACWSEDAIIFPPGLPAVRGAAAFQEYVEGAFALPGFSISWKIDEVHVSASSDMAYQIGTNVVSFDGPDGATVTEHGRVLLVWQKQADGSWKVASEVWNAGLPAGE